MTKRISMFVTKSDFVMKLLIKLDVLTEGSEGNRRIVVSTDTYLI